MNRTYSYFGRPLLGLVLGLFLVLTSRADEDAFTELGEAIAVEAKNKNLPMLDPSTTVPTGGRSVSVRVESPPW
jgi:hypothetical protein